MGITGHYTAVISKISLSLSLTLMTYATKAGTIHSKPWYSRCSRYRKDMQRQMDTGDETLCRHQIKELDRRIDAIVYDLYRLTSEEIMIVEKNSGSQAKTC